MELFRKAMSKPPVSWDTWQAPKRRQEEINLHRGESAALPPPECIPVPLGPCYTPSSTEVGSCGFFLLQLPSRTHFGGISTMEKTRKKKKRHLKSGCKIFPCALTESVQGIIWTWFCFCPASLDEREAFPGPLSRRRVKPCTRAMSRTSFLPPHFKCT